MKVKSVWKMTYQSPREQGMALVVVALPQLQKKETAFQTLRHKMESLHYKLL